MVLRVSGSVGSVGSLVLSVPSVLDRLDSPGVSGSLLGGRFSDTPRHFVTSQSHFQIIGGRRHGPPLAYSPESEARGGLEDENFGGSSKRR